MTMDPSQASSEQERFSGLSRLQLQAACVKAGLDTTANNDELRQLLQEHWDQTHPSNDNKEDAEASEGKTESSDIANETTEGTARVASVKHEDDELNASTPETTTAPVATSDSENVDVKVEEDQEMTPVKDEDSDNVSKVKKEELTESMTIAQRKRIWEAKTVSSSARSTSTTKSRPASRIPVAGTSSGQKRDRSPDDSDDIKKEEEEQSNSLPIPGTVQKLIGRFAGPSSSGADQNDVDGESKSMSMTPEPGSPASKRRRIDTQGTATTTGTGSMIKNTATKKVIKIPVAGSATRTRSPYAIGSTRANATKTTTTATSTTTTTTTASTKVTSTAMAMTRSAELRKQLVAASKKTDSTTAAGEAKKPESKPTKAVSAETINRLATPKKVKATSATPEPPTKPTTRSATPLSTKPTPLTTVAVSVPTRPRGPVLSTASRAAQRRNRTKE